MGADCGVQIADALAQFGDPHVVVVPDVRRRSHGRDPVRGRLTGHPECVLEILCPVIEARQDVTVQIDQPENAGEAAILTTVRTPSRPSTAIVIGASSVQLSTAMRAG